MAGGHILVVEDEEQIRKLLCAYLERRGYQVTAASDGREALEAIATEAPDLVITDLNMPRVNGLELLSALRQDARTSHVPIVLLSAQGAAEDVAAGLSHGADAYVLKPMEMSLLGSTVEQLLQWRPV